MISCAHARTSDHMGSRTTEPMCIIGQSPLGAHYLWLVITQSHGWFTCHLLFLVALSSTFDENALPGVVRFAC